MEPVNPIQEDFDPRNQFKRFMREERAESRRIREETNMSPEVHGKMLYSLADCIEAKIKKLPSTRL